MTNSVTLNSTQILFLFSHNLGKCIPIIVLTIRGLLSHLLNSEEEAKLIAEIQKQLSSPIGPQIAPGGLVWPAISQLMTWAYQDAGMVELSWDNMKQHLYSTHAAVFPTSWIGLMSGPDGWDSSENSSYPGGTWSSVGTID